MTDVPDQGARHAGRRPQQSFSRRAFLSGAVVGAAGTGAAAWGAWQWREKNTPAGHVPISALADGNAMPGKYPGRVIEVHRPGSVLKNKTDGYTQRDSDAVTPPAAACSPGGHAGPGGV